MPTTIGTGTCGASARIWTRHAPRWTTWSGSWGSGDIEHETGVGLSVDRGMLLAGTDTDMLILGGDAARGRCVIHIRRHGSALQERTIRHGTSIYAPIPGDASCPLAVFTDSGRPHSSGPISPWKSFFCVYGQDVAVIVLLALMAVCAMGGMYGAWGDHTHLDIDVLIADYQRFEHNDGSLIMLDVYITNHEKFTLYGANYRTDMAYALGETFVRLGGPANDGTPTESFTPKEHHTITNMGIHLLPHECTSYDHWRSIPPNETRLQRLCYLVDAGFEPDGLRVSTHGLLHGIDITDNYGHVTRLAHVVPFTPDSTYCLAHFYWCNRAALQIVPVHPPIPVVDIMYNLPVQTLTMVFEKPVLLLNQNNIKILYNTNTTTKVIDLTDATIASVDGGNRSHIFAFTLPVHIAGADGSTILVYVGAGAIHAGEPLTGWNGGRPLFAYATMIK